MALLKSLVNGVWTPVNTVETVGVADYIVEQGTSGIWTYRKWSSGIAECWGKTENNTINITTQWGSSSIYYSGGVSLGANFPSGLFTEFDSCTAQITTTSYSVSLMTQGTSGTTTHTPYYQAFRVGSLSNVPYIMHFHAFGKWK